MMKVKILTNDTYSLLERDINEFLNKIGFNKETKIELKDIKLSSSVAFNKETLTAMVIYNEIIKPVPIDSKAYFEKLTNQITIKGKE